MSLAVQHLTKVYGQQTAVNEVSFAVSPGEIVGFLGPNGAGKSTTMKIITGYLPPTSGSVMVGGYDVVEQPIEVKKILGYLPEHNPLYLDMYVHEYLRFCARLSGISKAKTLQRVAEMIALCGLGQEQSKKIQSLSKGYRQRVGLAQALLHDPQVLILDEPTSGLDPNQILEIRELIKNVSKSKTVLFSSHIMQEVQALCDRVVIINKGKIVADDRLSQLISGGRGSSIIVEFKERVPVDALKELQGVEDVLLLADFKCKVITQAGSDLRSALFRFAADQGLSLVELKVEEYSMENIFKELTTNSET